MVMEFSFSLLSLSVYIQYSLSGIHKGEIERVPGKEPLGDPIGVVWQAPLWAREILESLLLIVCYLLLQREKYLLHLYFYILIFLVCSQSHISIGN